MALRSNVNINASAQLRGSASPISPKTESTQKAPPRKKPFKAALATAAFRFFLALSLCLGLAILLKDPKIGGVACLSCFLILLADTKTTLAGRLMGTCIVLTLVANAVFIGYVCQGLTYGKWIVIIISCFGASLLSSLENFWWLVSKYFLIFLMVSLFDFSPDGPAVEGYMFGYLVSVLIITIDSFMWKIDQLGVRPMDQIKRSIGGDRNPKSFALIAALTLVVALWFSLETGMRESAWVGITVIFLIDKKIADGIKKSMFRVLGTANGYGFVVLLFTSPIASKLNVLGPVIVFIGMLIPVFISTNCF